MGTGGLRTVLATLAVLTTLAGLPACGGAPSDTFTDQAPGGAGGGGGAGSGGGSGGGPPSGGGGGTGGPGTPPSTPDPPPPPPAGDPIAGVAFSWRVNNVVVPPMPFVASAGPAGSAKNEVSRLQYTNELALVLYRRSLPGSAVSLLEVAVWNDPLVCQTQPTPGGVIPSQTIPNLEISVSGAQIYPMFPVLTTWTAVTDGQRYRLVFDAPASAKIADGAGFVWPFLVSTATDLPKATDIAALFPPNPGCMWGAVSANYPPKSAQDLAELSTGGLYFPAGADPWALLGKDVKYTPTTGFQPDWFWCHLGAYYARNDLTDIFYAMPTVYRQAARPCHYRGLDGDDPNLFMVMGRPGKWGTSFLGRVPASGAEAASYADDHGWTGPDHQHASLRRVAEIALATGSPYAWEETRYYGELAKPMLRTIDPAPYGQGFPNTPRGYLGWLEAAYRAKQLDPSYDLSYPIKVMEDFLELGHTQSYGKAWGQPQVMWAFMNDKWIPGHLAAASFEDLRAVPILLKIGQEFNRPKLITGALEKNQWYVTLGWTNGSEGKGTGIKNHVDPTQPSVFTAADLAGYGRISALGYKLAAEYLTANPTAGFNKTAFESTYQLIQQDAWTQSAYTWQNDLVGYLFW